MQVGSQVSGNIQWLGADFNSIVKKGQVIARLDPSLFEAQLQQARANLTQARANLTKAQSDLERTKVQLTDAQQKYTRAKELAGEEPAAAERARRGEDRRRHGAGRRWRRSRRRSTQAQAAVTQSQASVNQNQVNLDHTIITAPIDGIVTQRSVDVGQTVAASMQAPTLFVIAADLTKMQVNANIDEADVGRIRPGQHVTFRVDAYPTDNFEGTVSQIRLQPVVVQNVTTYGTVIDVPNPQLKLKPGMTANVKVEIAKRTDVLRVPNAALRFRPTAELFAALNQAVPPEAQSGGGRARRGGRAATRRPARGRRRDAAAAQPADSRSGAACLGATARREPGGAGDLRLRPGRPLPAGAGRRRRRSRRRRRRRRPRRSDPARMMERFKSMSPDEQKQFIARMKERGQDTSAFESRARRKPAQEAGGRSRSTARRSRRRRSTRCSRRCRRRNRAAAPGCSSTSS